MQINDSVLEKSIARCKERGVVIPTFAQLRDPAKVPQKIKDRLKTVGLWDIDPVNLFRITWKNEPVEKGGLYNTGNWIEFPSSLTGVPARIVGILGKWFPTGAHKVGAAFGCIVPRLVSGQFMTNSLPIIALAGTVGTLKARQMRRAVRYSGALVKKARRGGGQESPPVQRFRHGGPVGRRA